MSFLTSSPDFTVDLPLVWQGLFRPSSTGSFTREQNSARFGLTIQNWIIRFEDADVWGPPTNLDPDDYVCSLSNELRSFFLVRINPGHHINVLFCQIHISNIKAVVELGFITLRAHILHNWGDYSSSSFVVPLFKATQIGDTTGWFTYNE